MLLLIACVQPPPSRETVLAECGLGEADTAPYWWSEAEGPYASVDEACIAAMGDAFRVDWEAFGASPSNAADRSDPIA
jgi:hypothetical protein